MTILSVEPITNGLKVLLIIFFVIGMFGTGIAFGVVSDDSDVKKSTKIIVALCCVACIVGTCLCGFLMPNNLLNKYEYYVTIDDQNNADQYLDGYELIDRHGNVYRIKDK